MLHGGQLYLDVSDRQAEEQVHDDDGHEENEDGDQNVSSEREELRLGLLVDDAAREGAVDHQVDPVLLRIVELVVFELA